MTDRMRTFAVLSIIGVLLLSACAGAATPSATPAPGKVPNSLANIEAQAEDIIDVAPRESWQAINADVASISDSWTTYRPQAVEDGAQQTLLVTFDLAFVRLQAAATAQDKTATMQASNDISAVVVDLFDLYHPAIPVDVGRLDVLERQIVLDVAAGDFVGAEEVLANVNAVWVTLKPSVLAHQGEATAQQFEASLAAQAEALSEQDAGTLNREANDGLEIVDDMERLY